MGDIYIEDGTFEIAAGDDAVHAEDTLTVNGGTWNITECYEGFEALHVEITGGDITLIAADDGLNAAGGTDSSGMGSRDGMFGDRRDGMPGNREGGMPGGREGGMSGGRGGEMSGGQGSGMSGGRGGGMSQGNGSIVISGGKIHINASGDGIDANGTLEITGGYITVCGPTQGDTATLDYDTSGVISGGTFIGTGAAGMAQTFSSSENQGVISL